MSTQAPAVFAATRELQHLLDVYLNHEMNGPGDIRGVAGFTRCGKPPACNMRARAIWRRPIHTCDPQFAGPATPATLRRWQDNRERVFARNGRDRRPDLVLLNENGRHTLIDFKYSMAFGRDAAFYSRRPAVPDLKSLKPTRDSIEEFKEALKLAQDVNNAEAYRWLYMQHQLETHQDDAVDIEFWYPRSRPKRCLLPGPCTASGPGTPDPDFAASRSGTSPPPRCSPTSPRNSASCSGAPPYPATPTDTPPHTWISCPVTKAARRSMNMATTCATSSGKPLRPTGIAASSARVRGSPGIRRVEQFRRHRPRRHGVHRDAVGRQFQRPGPRHGRQRALGRAVGRAPRLAQRGPAADVDHAPVAGRAHAWQQRLQQHDGRHQVDGHGARQRVLRDGLDAGDLDHAGVVDQMQHGRDAASSRAASPAARASARSTERKVSPGNRDSGAPRLKLTAS